MNLDLIHIHRHSRLHLPSAFFFDILLLAPHCRGRWDKPPSEGGPALLKFTVHRNSLLQGGWAALHKAGPAVKGRLVVSFVNEQGMLEAGLDYGGLVKEFLEQVFPVSPNMPSTSILPLSVSLSLSLTHTKNLPTDNNM